VDYRINEWDYHFQSYLKRLEQQRGKPVVVTGDFNVAHQPIDVHESERNYRAAGYSSYERESFGKMIKSGFIDTYRQLYPSKR